MRKSEEEKTRFVEKYYPVKNRPKKSIEEKEPKGTVLTKTNGECTPKRFRDYEHFETGEFASPQKRRKSNISKNLNFGEGLGTGTLSAMRNFKHFKHFKIESDT